MVSSPSQSTGGAIAGSVNYKHMLEVWLDTLRDEYEIEASRSPLERGVLFGENRFLHTCFAVTGEEPNIAVTSSDASVSPLFRVPIDRVRSGRPAATTAASVAIATANRAAMTTNPAAAAPT